MFHDSIGTNYKINAVLQFFLFTYLLAPGYAYVKNFLKFVIAGQNSDPSASHVVDK